MKNSTTKAMMIYFAKLIALLFLIFFLISQLLGCQLHWHSQTWPKKYCPIDIDLRPAQSNLNAILLRKINCPNSPRKTHYRLLIEHYSLPINSDTSNHPLSLQHYTQNMQIKATIFSGKSRLLGPLDIHAHSAVYHPSGKPKAPFANNKRTHILANRMINQLITRITLADTAK